MIPQITDILFIVITSLHHIDIKQAKIVSKLHHCLWLYGYWIKRWRTNFKTEIIKNIFRTDGEHLFFMKRKGKIDCIMETNN